MLKVTYEYKGSEKQHTAQFETEQDFKRWRESFKRFVIVKKKEEPLWPGKRSRAFAQLSDASDAKKK